MLELKRDMEFMKNQIVRLKKLLHETLHATLHESLDPHPLEEQRDFFLTEVVTKNRVVVAKLDCSIVGFLAATADSISQLYVHVDHHRRGIGSMFVDLAKRECDGSLWLYTFRRNKIARRFYERHGFEAIEFGFEEMWQLPDVKYAWSRE